jgi:hypothetical protein
LLRERGGGLQAGQQRNRHDAQRHQHFDQRETTRTVLHGASALTANGRNPSVARRRVRVGSLIEVSTTLCAANDGLRAQRPARPLP